MLCFVLTLLMAAWVPLQCCCHAVSPARAQQHTSNLEACSSCPQPAKPLGSSPSQNPVGSPASCPHRQLLAAAPEPVKLTLDLPVSLPAGLWVFTFQQTQESLVLPVKRVVEPCSTPSLISLHSQLSV